MAQARWRRVGKVCVDPVALQELMLSLQFKLSLIDLNAGCAFALPQPGKRYDDRMMSILISWSPKRLDGYAVEIRSNESRSKTTNTCDRLAKRIAPQLVGAMGC